MRTIKITAILALISISISCSSDSKPSEEGENYKISSINPKFGYEGDEITFNMTTTVTTNASVEINYGNQRAVISEVNGNTIRHIVPNHPNVSKTLIIDNQIINIEGLYGLDKFIDCANCKEKALPPSNSDEVDSAISSIYKKDNKIYLIKSSRNSNYNYKTSLLETDLNFNLLRETTLFDKLPISKAIFESNIFVISNENGVFSFDLNGQKIWSYETTITSGAAGSTYIGFVKNTMLYYNSNYYVIKKAQTHTNVPLEIIKLNHSGQLLSTIYIPNPNPNSPLYSANIITQVNNKIIVTTRLFNYGDGYVVIDINDNILRNTYNQIELLGINNFVEGSSIYETRYAGGPNSDPIFELVKMTLDGDNYFQLDWTKPNYAGHIIKYNSKYLSIKRDKILIFNDNNFVNPTEFLATTENFSYLTINGAKVFNNDLYLFGNRTIENAYDYFSLIGRYDLNHIIN